MGKKSNPILLRGLRNNWQYLARWYTPNEYSILIKEDFYLRLFMHSLFQSNWQIVSLIINRLVSQMVVKTHINIALLWQNTQMVTITRINLFFLITLLQRSIFFNQQYQFSNSSLDNWGNLTQKLISIKNKNLQKKFIKKHFNKLNSAMQLSLPKLTHERKSLQKFKTRTQYSLSQLIKNLLNSNFDLIFLTVDNIIKNCSEFTYLVYLGLMLKQFWQIRLGKHINFSFSEIFNNRYQPTFLLKAISNAIRERVSVTRIFTKIIKQYHFSGLKLRISGRLNQSDRARSISTCYGAVSISTLKKNVVFNFGIQNTVNGIIGIKIWSL